MLNEPDQSFGVGTAAVFGSPGTQHGGWIQVQADVGVHADAVNRISLALGVAELPLRMTASGLVAAGRPKSLRPALSP